MTLSSMTGFARTEGQNETYTWSWEVKSVNAKGLDVRCRLGSGFDNLEPVVRERAAKRFKRGSLFINLTTSTAKNSGATQINHQVLDGIVNLIPELEEKFGTLHTPNVAELLALRGVLEPVDEGLTNEEKEALDEALLTDLDQTFDQLADMRNDEGLKLNSVLAEQLDVIANISASAEKITAAQPEAIRSRFKEQLDEILQSASQLPEDRLLQEVAVLVTKSDIREELDRLKAHEQAARALLSSGDAVGRKLDFLCQELNREANTLCSKSTDVELTNLGLNLKAIIEQFREQIQNIE